MVFRETLNFVFPIRGLSFEWHIREGKMVRRMALKVFRNHKILFHSLERPAGTREPIQSLLPAFQSCGEA